MPTSWPGARSVTSSNVVPAEDVAVCESKEQWLSAWDIPADRLLVVYGNKEYTDASNSHPDTARRMLTAGTTLEQLAMRTRKYFPSAEAV